MRRPDKASQFSKYRLKKSTALSIPILLKESCHFPDCHFNPAVSLIEVFRHPV